MTTHTAGPWDNVYWADGALFVGKDDVTLTIVAEVETRNESDAALIATAPELLDALIQLYNNPGDAGVRAFAMQTMRKAQGR